MANEYSKPPYNRKINIHKDIKGESLLDKSGAELETQYISFTLTIYIYTFSPECIIFGGGIMEQKNLLPLIHTTVTKILNNYIHMEEFTDNIEKYIVFPSLGKKAGILGALVLAKKEYTKCK
jgi:fructokinase